MTAWAVGAATTKREDPPGLDKLVEWIPGEVIAAYSAAVLALQPDDQSTLKITPGWLLAAGIGFAALLTFLGAWSKKEPILRKLELAFRIPFAGLAFAIWAFVVPGSWWHSLSWVADNEPIVPIAAGIVGLSFALFAEGAVNRIPEWLRSLFKRKGRGPGPEDDLPPRDARYEAVQRDDDWFGIESDPESREVERGAPEEVEATEAQPKVEQPADLEVEREPTEPEPEPSASPPDRS
jgi:hypothetical protein